MKSVRRAIIVVVINIFLMMLVTTFYEYVNLAHRFQDLTTTMQSSLESAVAASVGAEEGFTYDYDSRVFSYMRDIEHKKAHSTFNDTGQILVYGNATGGNGKFYRPNIYTYVMHTTDLSPNLCEIPRAQIAGFENEAPNYSKVYKYLYGGIGQDYTNIPWANKNTDTRNFYMNTSSGGQFNNSLFLTHDRVPTSEFKAYYDAIGKSVTSTMFLKTFKTAKTYELQTEEVPTLANMGLMLDSHFNGTDNSVHTMDNFSSSYKWGKVIDQATGQTLRSIYYLTPYSLGVTYIPMNVLKPVFIATLDTNVRLSKLASADDEDVNDKTVFNRILQEASGCISTSVYATAARDKSETHTHTDNIVNDGHIEYELDTAQLRVQYFLVNFSDYTTDSVARIIARVRGCQSAYEMGYIGDNPNVYIKSAENMINKEATSQMYMTLNGYGQANRANNKIIAKVSAKIKVHVCYESSLLQWLCQRFTGGQLSGQPEHYDIKLYNGKTGSYTEDDGLWYECSTYYVQTR